MFLTIPDALSKDDIAHIDNLLATCVYEPGAKTAGPSAKARKRNLQTFSEPGAKEAGEYVLKLLQDNKDFHQAAFIKKVNRPIFSLYTEDMFYNEHTDNAIMRTPGGMMRADLAMTVFLTDPDQYEGGELCTSVGSGEEKEFKLEAGSLLLYPANTIHRVNPITKGFRKVMVTWIQSFIRCHEQREILYKLMQNIGNPDIEDLSHIQTKLVRMWADV